jgi:hypothetical protein
VCGGNNACIPPAPSNRAQVPIYVLWGIKGLDRSSADNNDPFAEFKGDPIYDMNFDISSTEAQQHLLDFCEATLANNRLASADASRCFIKDFAKHCRETSSTGRQFPISQDIFSRKLLEWVVTGKGQQHMRDIAFRNFTTSPTVYWIQFHFKSVRLSNVAPRFCY